MERDFSAIAALERNVKFWSEQCGLTKEHIIRSIDNWYDFAYSPREQEAAKSEVKKKLIM